MRRTNSSGTSLAPCSTRGTPPLHEFPPAAGNQSSVFYCIAVRRTNRDRQAVDASQFDKGLASCGSVRNALSASTLMSSPHRPGGLVQLPRCNPGSGRSDNRFHQLHVLGKREVAAVDLALRTPAWTLRRISSSDSWWRDVAPAACCRLWNRHYTGRSLFQRDMFKGTWCPGEDHRRCISLHTSRIAWIVSALWMLKQAPRSHWPGRPVTDIWWR